MRVFCSPYTDDIENYIETDIREDDYILHIVPTKILQVRRRGFYRRYIHIQRGNSMKKDSTERDQSLFFQKNNIYIHELTSLMRELAIESEYRMLSNREAEIILDRIINEYKDISHHTWASNVSEIMELFNYLTISRIPIEKTSSFSEDRSWRHLIEIYKLYSNYLIESNYLDEPNAFLKTITSKYFNRFSKVYIDGAFLPITPLLHHIIERLQDLNKNIIFFIPFDIKKQTNPKFNVLRKTYDPYVKFAKWKDIKQSISLTNVVHKLADQIYEENKTISINDRTVKIRKYNTLEDEITDVVTEIVQLINNEKTKPEKIAIVTPNAMELRPMVKEGLELAKARIRREKRPLIDLPIGKFIYILYQLYIDDRISIFNLENNYIDKDMVANLLHLKIIPDSVEAEKTFNLIRSFFVDCKTFRCWYEQINILKKGVYLINHKYSAHPLYSVDVRDLAELEDLLKLFEDLSSYLISPSNRKMSAHVKFLSDFLSNYLPLNYQVEEKQIKEIMDKLDDYNLTLKNNEDIVISSREFGEKIHSILNDHDLNEESSEDKVVDITVTGPNNVEYQVYEYIYLIRFTQSIYPETPTHHWPLTNEIQDKLLRLSTNFGENSSNYYLNYMLERALYHFYIILNATEKNIQISFAREYDQIKQSASHYLYDIADMFLKEGVIEDYIVNGIDDVEENVLKELNKLGLYFKISGRPKSGESYKANLSMPIIKENTDIAIEDIAIYMYCPKRLYYEKKHPDLSIFTSSFQLQHYASACVYERVIELLVKSYQEINKENKDRVLLAVDDLVEEGVLGLYPLFPFPERYWEDIKRRTKIRVYNLIDEGILDRDHMRYVARLSLNGQSIREKIGDYYFKAKRELKVTHVEVKADKNSSCKPIKVRYYPISNLQKLLLLDHKNKRVSDSYFNLLGGILYNKKETKQALLKYSNDIARGSYSKKTGDHCNYCPFIEACMEKEIL